jgi:hypothetical protein
MAASYAVQIIYKVGGRKYMQITRTVRESPREAKKAAREDFKIMHTSAAKIKKVKVLNRSTVTGY